MITRIVSLKIKKNKVKQFISLYASNENEVKNVDGCLSLKLMTDVNNKNIFYTISEWDNVQKLNDYRNSDWFRSIWPQIKETLSESAHVVSLIQKNLIDDK